MNDLSQFLIAHGGPVLFALVFIEQAGLPIPSAPWLLTAGALSADGKLNPVMAIVAIALAAVLADSLWFYVGRRSGQRVLRLFCRLSLAQNSCPERTKHLFARHGLQALVAAKFLPGVGTVMPPLAGAVGMSANRFLLYDGFGSLVYGAFYILTGFVFHNQLQQALAIMRQLGLRAVLFALLLLAGYIAFKYLRRRISLNREKSGSSRLRPLREAFVRNDVVGGATNALEFPGATLTRHYEPLNRSRPRNRSGSFPSRPLRPDISPLQPVQEASVLSDVHEL